MASEREAKPCLISGSCRHGGWCSEVYCQEHCRFVKEIDQLDALASLCDEATGGWDLPPSATTRLGTLTRKAAAMLRKLVAEREEYRAAMRRALEALEWHAAGCGEDSVPDATVEAITHLRQRLEGTT